MRNPTQGFLKITPNNAIFPKLSILTKFLWLFSTSMIMIDKIFSTPEMTLIWSLFSDNYFCDWSFIHENRFFTFLQISPNFRHFLSRQGKKCMFSSKWCRKVFRLFSRVILTKTLEVTVSQRLNAHPRAYHFKAIQQQKISLFYWI